MDEEPLLDFAVRQLPIGIRRELGIPSLTQGRDGSVRFRLDPRQAFERAARISRTQSGDLRLVMSQRYRPHDAAEQVKDESFPGTSLAGRLQAQAGLADWLETRPHWQQACQRQLPEQSRTLPLRGGAVRDAQRLARDMAARTGTACYLWRTPDGLTCANNPPPSGPMFSVTPDGEWSAHSGETTRPLAMAPGPRGLVPGWGAAARIAARDRGTGAAATVHSDHQGAARAAEPAPGRITRRR